MINKIKKEKERKKHDEKVFSTGNGRHYGDVTDSMRRRRKYSCNSGTGKTGCGSYD